MQFESPQLTAKLPGPANRLVRVLLGVMLAIHLLLMVITALNNSACYDEGAHLAAGAVYWRAGEMSIYNLSPPLLRYIAAAPAYVAGVRVPPARRDRNIPSRQRHWIYLDAFQDANAGKMFRYVLWGRLALMPLSLATAWLIFRWSALLYGGWAGLLSGALWCFSPLVIAQGSTLGTDVGCAFAMTLTIFLWLRFLRDPQPARSIGVAGAFALGVVCKFTALLNWPTLLLVGGVEWLGKRVTLRTILTGWLICSIIAFVGFNAIYRFRLMGTALADFQFESRTMLALQKILPAALPVPLHRDAVSGFDAQKYESENRSGAVLFGQGYFGQDWRFYPVQWAMCESLGWLLLIALTFISFWRRWPTRDETLILVAVACSMLGWFVLTGLNMSLRYVLPTYPLAAVLAGRLVHAGMSKRVRDVLVLAAAAMAVETSAAVPHVHSFCNVLVRQTHFRPIGNERDWGQGLFDVRQWQRAQPLLRCCLIYFGTARPSDYGVNQVSLDHADDADVLIVSKLLLNGSPERVGGPFFLLRCWRELRDQKPLADLDGMAVYSIRQVHRTGVEPWYRVIHSWTEAWDDPKTVPFRNRPD